MATGMAIMGFGGGAFVAGFLNVALMERLGVARAVMGSVAVFPAPHQYMFARAYTTNMGYVWYKAWRGNISLGIRQHHDDDSPYYPWMNAPPGTEQEMRMFIEVSDGPARSTLDHVLRYTHSDHFQKLPGYIIFAPHWHLAYTLQARDHGFDWEPPFKPTMKNVGIDSAICCGRKARREDLHNSGIIEVVHGVASKPIGPEGIRAGGQIRSLCGTYGLPF